MKKNKIYVIVGIVALTISVFLIATLAYRRNERSQAEQAASSQGEEYRAKLIGGGERSLGPSAARVTVVEFFDPQCESCRAMHPLTRQVLAEFEGKIHFVARYMTFHDQSVYASKALEAAGNQGKYWEAVTLLFDKQPEWGNHEKARPELIPGYMKSLGLDMARFERDLNSPEVAAKVEGDKADGMAVGVRATPTFFVNGVMLTELGYGPLRETVRAAMVPTAP